MKILIVDTNNYAIEDILSSSFLYDKNLESLKKYKVEQVKKEKACSLILKNRYVGDYQINEFGKPISDKCFFNISHSKGVVVFIKDKYPIGIDVELVRRVEEDMVNYISSNEEKDYIKNDINFFEIWTNKESLTKAIGTGIKGQINEIPSLPINGLKKYKGQSYYSKTIRYGDFVISVSRLNKEPFDIEIEREKI